MPRSDYQERLEAKRERLEQRAEKAAAEADARLTTARGISSGIPFGQPILVGHHSERGHRSDLRKIDANMRKSVEASKKAKRLGHRAENLGRSGISSDDPEATRKLRAKVEKLEARQEAWKRINAAWRKAGKPGADDCEAWTKISEDTGVYLPDLMPARQNLRTSPFSGEQPFPRYALSNNNANIRRLRQRIDEIERVEAMPEAEGVEGVAEDGTGFVISEDRDLNRVRVDFEAKPSRDVTRIMRRAGFKWSRHEGAWLRLLKPGVFDHARIALGAEVSS